MSPKPETNGESGEVPQSQFLTAVLASSSARVRAGRVLPAGSGSPWVPSGGPSAQAALRYDPVGTQDTGFAPIKSLHLSLVSFSPIYKAET